MKRGDEVSLRYGVTIEEEEPLFVFSLEGMVATVTPCEISPRVCLGSVDPPIVM